MINENRGCDIIGINNVVAKRLEKGTLQQQKEKILTIINLKTRSILVRFKIDLNVITRRARK
jgi:hypothetical protein